MKKKKRIIDKELIKTYQSKKCEVCGCQYLVSAHHIKSRGAGGHDIKENLIALCIKHHAEVHTIGFHKFIHKYPHVKDVIIDLGWKYNNNLEKWSCITQLY